MIITIEVDYAPINSDDERAISNLIYDIQDAGVSLGKSKALGVAAKINGKYQTIWADGVFYWGED